MIEDELIRIWQSSSNQERIKFEKSKLMIELQSSLGRLHRWWRYLELADVIGAIIGILSFIFIAFWIPFTTSKIASVLIIMWLVQLIIRVLGIKKFKPSDLEENYHEFLKKSRRYLEVQKKLLDSYNYWGALPMYPIMFLFLLGLWEIPSKRYLIIIGYLVFVGIQVYSYFLNKRRVKNEINPRIAKIDELINELKR